MKIIASIGKMQEFSRQVRSGGLTVGFVPTMGYLHDGHLELIHRAHELADVVVVSIFVNPTQFNSRDDYLNYPIDEKADRALLEECEVDVLFTPSADEVYPPGASTSVLVGELTTGLCGAHRPGHFEGVATVVASLFNMVQPDLAVFGEKDYQQVQVIRRMTRDLHLPVRIVAAPTVRERDGLAMSSRNARLSAEHRELAPQIHAALSAAAATYAAGERSAARLLETARRHLSAFPRMEVEYLELVDGETLAPLVTACDGARIAVATWLGAVRLIDNVELSSRAIATGVDGRVEISRRGVERHA